jgi:uncharacterized protein with PQ loop repeat
MGMKTTIAFILLSIYTVLEFVAYMPQIVKLLKTKSADDLSLGYWFTWIAADLCYMAYVLLETPELGLIFIVSLDICFLVFVLMLTIYYQKHKKRKRKRP